MAAHRSARFSVLFVGALALTSTPVSAGIVTTEQVVAPSETTSLRPALAKELEARGVAPDEARARAEALSDAEVLAVSGHVDTLPAAGALNNTELLLLIIIILLIAL